MKIIGIGRNYQEHAKELNNPVPETPLIFFKPDTALLKNNQDFYYPEYSLNVHYECELVYRINREGKYINRRYGMSYVDGVGLGIDFTARDIQSEAKKKGHPWTLAKGFNHSAPVSAMLPPDTFANHKDIRFRLEINGETRQEGHTADMIFEIGYLIEYISQYITLKKGDLIFTGTPAGVGPVNKGDQLVGYLEGKKLLDFAVK